MLGVLTACSTPAATSPAPLQPTLPGPRPAAPVRTAGTSAPSAQLEYVAGSTRKVCQLIGDTDWQTGQPTAARTFTNFGLDAADLGYPVEHDGKLVLLFGDSWPPPHPAHESAAQSELPPDDSVGITQRTAPPSTSDGRCLELQINHDTAGHFIPATITGPVKVHQGSFNVPTGGVSVNGTLFAFFWTNHCTKPDLLAPVQSDPLARPLPSPQGGCTETDDRNSIGTSVLAQSQDDARTFSGMVPMPTGFVYSAAVDASTEGGLPADQRLGVFVFGVPRYRASIPYLAYAPAQTFSDPSTWRFFTGRDSSGQPSWVTAAAWNHGSADLVHWNPPAHAELFTAGSSADSCVGELSVSWSPQLGRWLMLYACRGQVLIRMAQAPWGPWSQPIAILSNDGSADCQWLMSPQGCGDKRSFWPKLPDGNSVAGNYYAPYLLNRYTTVQSGSDGAPLVTIYWNVSTWNPYEVMVMQSSLRVVP